MSLSTKLTAAYAVIVMVVASALTLTLYVQLSQAQRTILREHLRDIVSFAGTQIDGDFHALIVSPDDAASSYYRIIKETLQQIQRTSRAIKHIYTLRQQSDGSFVVIVDNDDTTGIATPLETDHITPLLAAGRAAIQQPIVEDHLTTHTPGHPTLFGYGPIVDQFGRQDGVLAVELDASLVAESEVRARNTALTVFVISLPVVLLIGIGLVHRLTLPIAELLKGAERISQGQLDHRVPVHSSDELGVLAATFNAMADTLQARIVAEQQAQHDLSASHQQLQAYNHTLEQAMQEQQRLSETVRQMSLPVIPVAERIIVVPLVGAVDSNRAQDLVETVLQGVEQHQARVVLVDLTGVPLLDEQVAQALLRTITAARLLGARVLLVGIRPELAETFTHVAADLSALETSATLQSGLLRALRLTGLRVMAAS